jgi:hypothetical protein
MKVAFKYAGKSYVVAFGLHTDSNNISIVPKSSKDLDLFNELTDKVGIDVITTAIEKHMQAIAKVRIYYRFKKHSNLIFSIDMYDIINKLK